MAIKTTSIGVAATKLIPTGFTVTSNDTDQTITWRKTSSDVLINNFFIGGYVKVFNALGDLGLGYGYVTEVLRNDTESYVTIDFASNYDYITTRDYVSNTSNGEWEYEVAVTVPLTENWTIFYAIDSEGQRNVALRISYAIAEGQPRYAFLLRDQKDGVAPAGAAVLSDDFEGRSILIVYDDGL